MVEAGSAATRTENSGAQLLATEGFVTASLFYRLSGDALFPADIEDCKCVIRFLRANAAKYEIDPDRIGVAGASVGGHLAELVATTDSTARLEGNGGGGKASPAECKLHRPTTEYRISRWAPCSSSIIPAKWS
jgi:acetyl esterase/lipase